MQAGQASRIPHHFEARLKTIMRNIRATGADATPDDYHVVLHQFAAVGHYTGAMQVLAELTHVCKLDPFGLCLKAIAHPSQHYSQEFDDEDDFGIANPASTEPHLVTPHARPNTTSYNILLKHISRAGHATFARHYLYQAVRLDCSVDRLLRSQLYRDPHGTLAPHFSLNRGTIIPVFGESNRDKNIELMRWVGWVTRQTIRRKKNDIAWYSELRDSLPPPFPSEPTSCSSSSSSPPDVSTALDVGLDTPSTAPEFHPQEKIFDINLHLNILIAKLGR
ncbi:uncharacterized protein F5891DRAFT_1243019 [Suillus fuscotomentosus]|uniref:Uncharacterized protein n=1 Tax=Suillus fuscotomentosus TaxID=1912939 RepID=A0AAD4HBK9_9AGAM|nr:uncharacterized protein F5891DRAFT_1243019 [Suillus fuscotomentosus]KAG1883877.1 hypothetical protein F5891DRAFT_1243019 [Suillus fuscotomentosus]